MNQAGITRLHCRHCYLVLDSTQTLRAANPFEPADTVTGCPRCHRLDPFESLCDVPGCPELCSIGTPTAAGYRLTCHKHDPMRPDAEPGD